MEKTQNTISEFGKGMDLTYLPAILIGLLSYVAFIFGCIELLAFVESKS